LVLALGGFVAMTVLKKKLIEVALPLEAINKASAREKSIRYGHPSTLHLWWARRPLAAARAVIFAQMVDDPSASPDLFPTEKTQEKERQRLFRIIEDLVLWENTTNEKVLQAAREEIWQSWRRACAENADHPRAKELFDRHKLPAFHDPFAGGGSLPLEAQRLGLEAYASDLNPVAVLINKAMIEIPPKFAGRPPLNPTYRSHSPAGRAQSAGTKGENTLFNREWKGAEGLAEDVRYYGKWMRDEAEKRIGHLYPKIEITADMAKGRPDLKPYIGKKLTVIAWLWARTVKSPNPAFAKVDVPLTSTFMLSTKPGKEAYVEPVIEDDGYHFTVRMGKPKSVEEAKHGTRAGKAQDFRCLMSGVPVQRTYIREEGKAGRLGERLMAIVVDGERTRLYLPPTESAEALARQAAKSPSVDEARTTFLSGLTPTRAMITGGVCSAYGLSTWGHLFTQRQLLALITFSDLVREARNLIRGDALAGGMCDDEKPLRLGGTGASAYAEAVDVYLAFAISKVANIGSSLASWMSDRGAFRETFARQAIPMVWDFAEANPFADAGGSLTVALDKSAMVIDAFPGATSAIANQLNASLQVQSQDKVVSTDPPYYDNIGYADLSDFFYVWLRRSMSPIFPDLFATLTVPKAEELVATLYRHGSREKAEIFFLQGMTQAMRRLAEQAHPAFPVTIYYAFKQSETDGGDGSTNTGWDTFLAAVIEAGFAISGTWPMRTEGSGRMIAMGTNALASSIILVCRPHNVDAPVATRREFLAALKVELPSALAHLQRGNIAPVDLAQAAIGPGMAVYTRYSKVLDAEGKPLPVREALSLINQTLDDALAEQEGDFDGDSRWSLAWFDQYGFAEGEYGVAETLATAKNTSIAALARDGFLASKSGKVRLLRPSELPADWDPANDTRLTVWEMVHHLIRVLESGGESAAAELSAKIGAKAETARELAYRLYTICERKKRATEALSYNALVQSWPEISRLSREGSKALPAQQGLFAETEG
jgi:putative DNA methylase